MRKTLATLTVFSVLLFAGFALRADEMKGALSPDEFAIKAASSSTLEVKLGQLAQEKALSPEVKAFGNRMVTDHGKSFEQLNALAQQKNWTLSDQLDPKHQSVVDDLSKLSGADFDKEYMRLMVKGHAKKGAKFRHASTTLQDNDLKSWISSTLPVIEEHLTLAKTVGQKVGVDVAAAEKEGLEKAEEMKTQHKN
jgi:putative membrane protein